MKVIITGGAGFIGTNAASRYLRKGDEVVVIDDLSRTGAASNLNWLRRQGRLTFIKLDLRDRAGVDAAFAAHRESSLVLHLAAQVAVTTSLVDPRSDFEVNALGTFNVLEAMRLNGIQAPLIYSSTNKVYGKLAETRVIERDGRYFNLDFENGVAETQPVDFVSPYGCSKGAADEYVRDYHSMYGLNTVVFRQSCIYGDRQFGCEDQGWVAWLTIAALTGRPITIYGDGKQVRDLLHVQDLIDAFDAAARKIDVAAGSIYNLGGGPGNAVSVLEVLAYLERLLGRRLPHDYGDWRNGDQRYYVSDIGLVSHDLNWQPRIGWREGLNRLFNWVVSNRHEF